ncbi:MAG: diguanylate cyclase [Spirochaetota bacterium]|nr:diguanylate cyclase [Spirochaetota bacterium]
MELSGKTINQRYRIVEKIDEDLLSIYWRATMVSSNDEVAIRLLKHVNSTYRVEDLIRLKKEIEIISKIDHPCITKIIDIDEYTESPDSVNYTFIVTESIQGISLYSYLIKNAMLTDPFEALEEDKALEIIANISEALQIVHENGIVHRDLNPENIWLIPGNGHISQIKISGFGLMELKELSKIKRSEDIITTFSYMSPEASGIVNKKIDERSDLYSLGVLFYQLLTGKLPFIGNDVNTILHKHIAMEPSSPSMINRKISHELDAIISKLLKKDQDERYQSAMGLLVDIHKVWYGERGFELGTADRRLRLSFQTGLIGRDKELTLLKELYNNASESKGSICLIGGEAGSGKTRLVEELRGEVFDKGGIFISGKCFAGRNKMPYQVFHDALNEYLDSYNKLNDRIKIEIRDGIRGVTGELGEIILNLNPSMQNILGDVKPIIRLDGDIENERFMNVASNLFCSLGIDGTPIVLFLDDLHWADESSLLLLIEIADKIKRSPLLILGTYRDNEISEKHGLNRIIKDFHGISKVKVNLFDSLQLESLVTSILGIKGSDLPHEVIDYIFEKSKGNPFFGIELLRQLLDEEVIIRGITDWTIDNDKIEMIEVPDSVIEIVLKRIKLLGEEERDLIAYGAIIGSKFDIDLLFKLSEINQERILTIIDKAIDLQLLEKSPFDQRKLLFVHDRVRDAFCHELSTERERMIHLKIAQALEVQGRNDDVIFSLARHYTEAEEHDKSLKYLIPAGNIAKERYANEEAIRYYRLALKLLEEKCQDGINEWVETSNNLGEVFSTIGNYDEAIEIFNRLLPYTDTPNSKANIYNQINRAYFKKGNSKECEEFGREGLRLLDEYLPVNTFLVIVSIIKEFLIHLFFSLFPGLYNRNKENPQLERDRLIINIYHSLNWSYALNDVLKFVRSILRMLNVSMSRIGKSKELGLSMGGFASLCMVIGLFKRSIEYNVRSLKLKEELSDQWGIAQSLQFMGFCYQWMGEYIKSIDCFNKSITKFEIMGDSREIVMSINCLISNYIYLCDIDRATALIDQYIEIIEKSNDDFQICFIRWINSELYFKKGDYEESERWGIRCCNHSFDKELWVVYCRAKISLCDLFLEKGDIKTAFKHVKEAKEIYKRNNLPREYTISLYTYLAEITIADYLSNEGITSGQRKSYLRRIKKICKGSLLKTRRWPNHYGIALRVYGKYYALIGKNRKAEALFIQAIDHEKRLGRRYELAKNYYEYGLYFNNKGNPESARTNWQKAYTLFKEIDSKIYLQRISNLLGITDGEDSYKDRFLDKRRLSSIITVSQQISSILNIKELLESIVANAIEVAGAMRGFLFIYDEESNYLELRASKSVEQGKIESDELLYSKEIVDDVYNKGQIIMTQDAMEDDSFTKYRDLESKDLRSILCMPINHRDKRIGVFYLDNRLSKSVFDENDIELLGVFISQAAISIENASLYSNLEKKVKDRTEQLQALNKELEEKSRFFYEFAQRDSLTGLLNHSAVHERLRETFNESQRHKFPMSVVMIDIDYFKEFNDNYGHQAGDEILIKVSMIFKAGLLGSEIKGKFAQEEYDSLKEELRKYDIAGRYGGDEFILVLPYCGERETLIVSERLRKKVEAIRLSQIDEACITSTLGVAILDEKTSCNDSTELVSLADKALYEAKMKGRNQICLKKYE